MTSISNNMNGDDRANQIEDLVNHIRSEDEEERKLTISQIPTLIRESLQHKNEILNQLLLVIHNLNTTGDSFEVLNLGNRTQVIRNLLRLYTETIKEHEHEQLEALVKLVDPFDSSELLKELAFALYQCSECNINKQESSLVEDALCAIREKAAINLYSDTLLMVHSIMAVK